jgi:hypothetical protein
VRGDGRPPVRAQAPSVTPVTGDAAPRESGSIRAVSLHLTGFEGG